MQLQEILRQADEILFEQTGEHLDDLQSTIIEESLKGQKYKEIANTHHRTEGHIRDVAYKLWEALSISLGQEVNKYNLRSVMERSCVFNIRNSGNSINSGRIDNLNVSPKDNDSRSVINQNNDLKIIAVNSDLEIVIPNETCKQVGLKQGQEFQIVQNGEKLELIPYVKSDRDTLWEKMRQLREKIVTSTNPLLNHEEIERLIEEERTQVDNL